MVLVSDYQHEQREAIAFTATPAFREAMRARAAIERIIAGLTRYNGARRARSTGIVAANHQVRMAAVAYNLKRWHELTRRKVRIRRKEGPPDAPT